MLDLYLLNSVCFLNFSNSGSGLGIERIRKGNGRWGVEQSEQASLNRAINSVIEQFRAEEKKEKVAKKKEKKKPW